MSDATQDLQGTAPTPDAEPDINEDAPSAPHGTETALGGMTRDTLRAASPVMTQIREALTFHDSGTASQAVRDVLGAIERAADEASRRRPRNRPPEFAELSPPALRQLAALCRVYRVESVDSTPATLLTEVLDAEPIETMTIGSGDGIDVVIVNGMPMSRQMFEEHRADSVALNEAVAPLLAEAVERLAAEGEPSIVVHLDNTHATFTPDPFVGPAPLTPMEQIGEVLAAGVAAFTSDPFATPAPLPAEEDEPIRVDGSDQPPL
jgi:hypothetical protein